MALPILWSILDFSVDSWTFLLARADEAVPRTGERLTWDGRDRTGRQHEDKTRRRGRMLEAVQNMKLLHGPGSREAARVNLLGTRMAHLKRAILLHM